MLPYLFMVSLVAAAEARAQGSYAAPSNTNTNANSDDTGQMHDADKSPGAATTRDDHSNSNMNSSESNANTNSTDTSDSMAKSNSDLDKSGRTAANKDFIKDVPHITLNFKKGSSVLSSDDESKLRELVNQAQTGAKIDQMTVASWSDKALPKEGQKLSDADQRLAKGRSDAVYMFLKDQLNVPYVATYNMAEDANWLAKTFRTSDAELKSLFSKKGTQTPVTNNEMKIIKDEGGPSKVVVLVERNP